MILNTRCLLRSIRNVIKSLWSLQRNSHFLVKLELPYVPFTASHRVLMEWRTVFLTHFHISYFHIIPLPFETLYLRLSGPPLLFMFSKAYFKVVVFFSLLLNIWETFQLDLFYSLNTNFWNFDFKKNFLFITNVLWIDDVEKKIKQTHDAWLFFRKYFLSSISRSKIQVLIFLAFIHPFIHLL